MADTKERVFAAVTILLSVVASLVLCEVMARAFAPPWLKQRLAILNPDPSAAGFGTDTSLKVEYREGKFLKFTPNSRFDLSHVEYSNVANIDQSGGRRVSSQLASNLNFLPLLGDSFTFGVGVEDRDTFASKLADELPAYRVINLGLPGSGLENQIQIIKFRHAEFNNPSHYLIFFFLGNDFADSVAAARRSTSYMTKSSMTQRKASSVLWLLNDFVYHNTILKQAFSVQLVRRFLLQLLSTVRLAQGQEPVMNPVFLMMNHRISAYQVEACKAIRAQLTELKMLQAKLNFTTMIVAIPDAHQLDLARRQLMALGYGISPDMLEPLRPNHLLKTLVEREGFDFFDSTKCLERTRLGGRLYYQQDDHLQALGHDALARCVLPVIERFLISAAAPVQ